MTEKLSTKKGFFQRTIKPNNFSLSYCIFFLSHSRYCGENVSASEKSRASRSLHDTITAAVYSSWRAFYANTVQ